MAGPAVARLLDAEARALLTRLDRVKPFALHETMVPAAALLPATQLTVERFLATGRAALRRRVQDYVHWLAGEGARASAEEQQRRFVLIRMSFNDVLSQFDLFTEVVTQRSEHETGVWLSGLDALAADALQLQGIDLQAPPVTCYLARGPGAAIRRARTRLPGGAANPVAIIRVPRERMVGHGIASSLIHEVGHQAAALLDLVSVLRAVLHRQAARAGPAAGTWACFEKWVSEIVADLWSVAKLGIGSTLGLIGVVSLPRWFVFRPSGDDPHPVPWIRVRLSCALGQGLYPHRQWGELSAAWESMYPRRDLPAAQRRSIDALDATVPAFVEVLLAARPPALRGAALGPALRLPDRQPETLLAAYGRWRQDPRALAAAPPTAVFAAVGQARSAGVISAETESQLLADLLRGWALRSTLQAPRTAPSPRAVPSPLARRAS